MDIGVRMPFCAGMASDRQFYSFDRQAGRTALLVLSRMDDAERIQMLARSLSGLLPELDKYDADLVVIAPFSVAAQLFLVDPDCGGVSLVVAAEPLFESCGVAAGGTLVVVIDRGARVMGAWPVSGVDCVEVGRLAVEVIGRLPRETTGVSSLPAPVLPVRGLLEPALCQALIERFESSANFDSGLTGSDLAGQARSRVDHDRKRRRDWMLQPGDGLHEAVSARLFRRCAPEIERAFQHRATHADRILVARYDGEDGGCFRRHRDNTAPQLAFRRFAVSVNLNEGGYEGGHLLFPEYNDHRYRPAAGEGLVFSASLLHEATQVTVGRRYVLLTFLHDAEAEASRLASAGGSVAEAGSRHLALT